MMRHTLEISRDAVHLASQRKQLLLKRSGDTTRFFPFEDIGFVVVDHPQTTYSHAALQSLLDSDAALVVCGKNHLPSGVLLPLGDHSEVVWRIHDQIGASRPVKKNLWKQIVQAKIRAQARFLSKESQQAAHQRLLVLARTVRSGDTANNEAQAARVYWAEWSKTLATGESEDSKFRRERFGDGPNPLLNYGYSILRAAVARAVVSAGMLPAIGIHHHNRSNAFCLADDLMEPLRPLVDDRVRRLWLAGHEQVTPDSKRPLLEVLTAEVVFRDQFSPLMVALHGMAASLAKCLNGKLQQLEIPRPSLTINDPGTRVERDED